MSSKILHSTKIAVQRAHPSQPTVDVDIVGVDHLISLKMVGEGLDVGTIEA